MGLGCEEFGGQAMQSFSAEHNNFKEDDRYSLVSGFNSGFVIQPYQGITFYLGKNQKIKKTLRVCDAHIFSGLAEVHR